MDCSKCSEAMQKLCATYPASYDCGQDADAYREEMRKQSGMTERNFIYNSKEEV
jgi:hypothetical protein